MSQAKVGPQMAEPYSKGDATPRGRPRGVDGPVRAASPRPWQSVTEGMKPVAFCASFSGAEPTPGRSTEHQEPLPGRDLVRPQSQRKPPGEGVALSVYDVLWAPRGSRAAALLPGLLSPTWLGEPQ